MKLKSMKVTKADQKEMEKAYSPSMDKPRYPYGLEISLDKGSMDKLGFKKLPEVGEEVEIMAKAKVTSVSMSETEGGGYKSMRLQITEMACEHEAKKDDGAEKMYS